MVVKYHQQWSAYAWYGVLACRACVSGVYKDEILNFQNMHYWMVTRADRKLSHICALQPLQSHAPISWVFVFYEMIFFCIIMNFWNFFLNLYVKISIFFTFHFKNCSIINFFLLQLKNCCIIINFFTFTSSIQCAHQRVGSRRTGSHANFRVAAGDGASLEGSRCHYGIYICIYARVFCTSRFTRQRFPFIFNGGTVADFALVRTRLQKKRACKTINRAFDCIVDYIYITNHHFKRGRVGSHFLTRDTKWI